MEWYKKDNPNLNNNKCFIGISKNGKYITVAVFKDKLYNFTDYGKTPINSITTREDNLYTGGVYISDNGLIQTVPIQLIVKDLENYNVLMSKDGGQSWDYFFFPYIEFTYNPGGYQFTNICGNSKGTIQFISVYGKGIFYYTDNDFGWKMSDAPNLQWSSIVTIEVTNKTYTFAIANTNSTMYYTTNNMNWYKIPDNQQLPTYGNFDFLKMDIKNNYITIVNNTGSIYTSKIFFNDDDTFFINPYIVYSTNYNSCYSISMSNTGQYQYITTQQKYLVYSLDFGVTFNIQNLDYVLYNVLVNDTGDFKIGNSNNNLYISSSTENIIYSSEKSLFMRGSNFSIPQEFYLVGRSQNSNIYYYLTINSDNTLIFTSLDYQSLSEYKFPKVKLNYISKDLATYSLSINDVIIQSVTINNYDSMNNNLATYLYPGLWYRLFNSDLTQITWNLLDCTTSNIFCVNLSNIVQVKSLDIMFIPINNDIDSNNISIWKQNSENKYTCLSYLDNPQLGLNLFNNWILNNNDSPVNCSGDKYLTNLSNNCYFTNTNSCNQGYLYDSTLNDICGNNLGICTNYMPCIYDYNNKKLSCSDNPTPTPTPEPTNDFPLSIILIVFICIIILIVIICLFISFGVKKNKENN